MTYIGEWWRHDRKFIFKSNDNAGDNDEAHFSKDSVFAFAHVID